MRFFIAILIALLVAHPVNAQEKPKKSIQKVQLVEVVEPIPNSFSNNVVFVVDSSSSIYSSKNLNLKLRTAWYRIFKKMGTDEVYFSIYSFNNKDEYKFRKWEPIGFNTWRQQLKKAFVWTRRNKGVFSFGKEALIKAIKENNPLNKNPGMKHTLTIVLITDGGLTEAAEYGTKNNIKKGTVGAYNKILSAIDGAQKWRKIKGWPEATICAIGLENLEHWSISVKRPNSECQQFLKTLGTKYNGGYFLVRNTKRKAKAKK